MHSRLTVKSITKVAVLLLPFIIVQSAIADPGKPGRPLPIAKKIRFDVVTSWNYDAASSVNAEMISSQSLAYLSGLVEENVSDRKNKTLMLHFLRRLKVNRAFKSEKVRAKLYDDMATISAKMKLYPLAMQFCNEELKYKIDANSFAEPGLDSSNNLAYIDTIFRYDARPVKEDMQPVTAGDILQSFNDSKDAASYAMMVHVKQPVKGKRKAFTGIDNVGHMFVTLIKYNEDKTYVSRTFGFYPDKNSLLSATPLKPSTISTLKDDARHDWDEAVGKFISYKRFTKIIRLLTKYQYKPYDLNENNCTDFGLTIAALSGIQIQQTTGRWPMGKGNNPANAGQSILENKIATGTSEEAPAFFVFKNQ